MRRKAKSKTFLLLPGNPPITHFYDLWIKELKNEFPDSTFKTLSFPFFTNKCSAANYFKQVENHFSDIIKEEKCVTLIGHSIGGKFTLDLLQKYPERIDRVFLIFPFFGKPKKRGQLLLDLSTFLDRRTKLSRFIVGTVSSLQKRILNKEIFKENELKSGIRLGRFEQELMRDDVIKYSNLNKLKDKIFFFYNSNDVWCTLETKTVFKPNTNLVKINIRHDFIIHKSDRSLLTRKISPLLFSE